MRGMAQGPQGGSKEGGPWKEKCSGSQRVHVVVAREVRQRLQAL